LRYFCDIGIIQPTPSGNRRHESAETLNKGVPSFARSGSGLDDYQSEIVRIGIPSLGEFLTRLDVSLNQLIDYHHISPIRYPPNFQLWSNCRSPNRVSRTDIVPEYLGLVIPFIGERWCRLGIQAESSGTRLAPIAFLRCDGECTETSDASVGEDRQAELMRAGRLAAVGSQIAGATCDVGPERNLDQSTAGERRVIDWRSDVSATPLQSSTELVSARVLQILRTQVSEHSNRVSTLR
jgi:hypothetical protein